MFFRNAELLGNLGGALHFRLLSNFDIGQCHFFFLS